MIRCKVELKTNELDERFPRKAWKLWPDLSLLIMVVRER
jgi:hypothetical protein